MKRLLLWLIRFYQKCISPLFPRCCRYYPSCSHYAGTAIARFGVCKGSALALTRLLRCNPWARGGVDFVPETFSWNALVQKKQQSCFPQNSTDINSEHQE
ncbi:MAG: membrane protein insertion efficiency factor YidD [Oscillospiraceae bacterium]|jgi:putative membrane protein insertion efficiency factor|nr:membrane protein insertion efficiency factor YidD [Oscillospiraceae bacterium]